MSAVEAARTPIEPLPLRATGNRWRQAGVVGGILAVAVAAAVDFLIIASGHPDIAFVPTIVAWAVVLNRVGARYRVASVRGWIG